MPQTQHTRAQRAARGMIILAVFFLSDSFNISLTKMKFESQDRQPRSVLCVRVMLDPLFLTQLKGRSAGQTSFFSAAVRELLFLEGS